ncbi:MAG: CDP-diacylglycerol--serine O-phosphatidyltransferase [Phascolarctobacterium sp.]|nr:CDP-diacylglycerol--serine O-phosphatidyltransferase [Phascolarctobacterium sp.]
MNYKLRRLVPNGISSLSLVLGVLSIFMSIEKDFFHAALFIVLAMLADSMDGRAARFLGVAGGRFGIEMDSLCDLASFGVAPAIMIYQYGMQDLGMTGMVIASFFTIGGALRLARFNCNVDDVKGYFQGMPIPAGACCLATYVLSGYQAPAWYVAALTFGVAVIMYSEVKYPDFKGKGNPMFLAPCVVALAIGVYMLYQTPGAWPFIAMFTYTIAGVINFIYALVLGK